MSLMKDSWDGHDSKTDQHSLPNRLKAKKTDSTLWIRYTSQDFWLYLLLLLVYGTVVPTNFTQIKFD